MFTFSQLPKSPIIMAIVNVTPDSFSDGGLYYSAENAYEKASRDYDNGADIIDIGGESSRPGSDRIGIEAEIERVIPVIKKIRTRLPRAILSIDTHKVEVAHAALNEGVHIVNDITGGRDLRLLKKVKEFEAGLVIMHMQGNPKTMQRAPTYVHVVNEIVKFLNKQLEQAMQLGILKSQICVDPGIGFGKTLEQNYEIFHDLKKFVNNFPCVMLGASRKKFLRDTLEETDARDILGATCATTTYGVFEGIKIFRVHEVKPNRHAAKVAWTIKNHESIYEKKIS